MKKRTKILSAILCVIVIVCITVFFGNNLIQTTTFEYSNEKIPADFDGFKIVQISDLHNKLFGKNQKRLIKKISSLSPDIIVFTGDMVSRRETNLENAEIFIKEALKICPVYYVEGNHEKYSVPYSVYFKPFLESAGVHTLRNELEKIFVRDSYMTICGVHDLVDATEFGYDVYEREEVYCGWIKDTLATDDDSFKILLSHRPEFFETYAENGADLIFVGHAHGGQVILPFVGGIYAPNQGFFPKYYAGEYKSGSSTMIVSRGLGNSIFFPRINNLPEIVCTTLKHFA